MGEHILDGLAGCRRVLEQGVRQRPVEVEEIIDEPDSERFHSMLNGRKPVLAGCFHAVRLRSSTDPTVHVCDTYWRGVDGEDHLLFPAPALAAGESITDVDTLVQEVSTASGPAADVVALYLRGSGFPLNYIPEMRVHRVRWL